MTASNLNSKIILSAKFIHEVYTLVILALDIQVLHYFKYANENILKNIHENALSLCLMDNQSNGYFVSIIYCSSLFVKLFE